MDSKIEYLQTLMAKKRLKGLQDLYFFNKYIVEEDPDRRKFIVPHVHGEWASWYQNSKARIKVILVPRSCFKSTFFTVGLTLQKLARDRNERLLVANATQSNSDNFLTAIKDHIRRNKTYQDLYGHYRGKYTPMFKKNLRWNNSEFAIAGRDLGIREANVTSIGVGGNLVSQHYTTIIGDDLVNNENSSTKYQADKVIDWWKKSLSLLEPDGEMIIIGTRWSYYELYSYLIDNYPDKIDYYIRGAYNDEGKFYFPERFNEEKLKELKEYHGSYIFSAFYLNDPVDEDSALIKESQIRYYGENEEKALPKNLNIFSMCDPAVSQQTRADYSTIVTVGIDHEDNWYVLDINRDKYTVGELVNQLFATYSKWEPIGMSIEVIGQAQGLMSPIRDEEEKRAREGKPIYLPLTEIKSRPQYRKELRIRSVLQPRFERGKVFIRADMEDLKEELLKFPKSKHDDIIDPLTDLDEIGFLAEKKEEEKKDGENSMPRTKLRPVFLDKNDYDPVMGEYY